MNFQSIILTIPKRVLNFAFGKLPPMTFDIKKSDTFFYI